MHFENGEISEEYSRFGAAFSVMILGTGVMASSLNDALNISNPVITPLSAFFFP